MSKSITFNDDILSVDLHDVVSIVIESVEFNSNANTTGGYATRTIVIKNSDNRTIEINLYSKWAEQAEVEALLGLTS